MKITSSAFNHGEEIPRRFTCDDIDISPPLSWTDVPEGTKSFVLICDDPDAPVGTWVHWVLYNLPASTTHLPKAIQKTVTLSNGALQGKNDFRRIGYGGPCPPPGHGYHRYFFKLYAINSTLDLKSGATKEEILNAINGHVLAETNFQGKYKRPG